MSILDTLLETEKKALAKVQRGETFDDFDGVMIYHDVVTWCNKCIPVYHSDYSWSHFAALLMLCCCETWQVLGHQPWTVRHWWRCTSHKARWWSNKTSPATPSTSCTRPGTNMPWPSMAMAINGHQWPSMAMPCVEDGTGLTGSSLFQLRTLVPAPPCSCPLLAMP